MSNDDEYTTELNSIVSEVLIANEAKRKTEDLVRILSGRSLPYSFSHAIMNKRLQRIDATSSTPQRMVTFLRDTGKVFTGSHSPTPGEWGDSGRFSSQPIPESGMIDRLLPATTATAAEELYEANATISNIHGTRPSLRASDWREKLAAARAVVLRHSQVVESFEKIKAKQKIPMSPPTSRVQEAFSTRGSTETTPALTTESRVVGTSTNVQRQSQPLTGMAEAKTPYETLGGGIQIKKTPRASLRLKRAPSIGITSTADFFLTDVRETTNEKFQIIQTFGADFLFAFGRKPLMYTFSGVVYNTKDKQWKNNLRFLYDNKFRATQLIKAGRRAVLSFEDVTVEGYLLNMDMSLSSQNPHAVPFSFTMYITKDLREGITIAADDQVVFGGTNAGS